jgi:hypothetical protein
MLQVAKELTTKTGECQAVQLQYAACVAAVCTGGLTV